MSDDAEADAFVARLTRDAAEWDAAHPEQARLRRFLWQRLGLSGAADQTDSEVRDE